MEKVSNKDLEMEAGRVIIAQAARQVVESRNRLEEERQEEKEREREKAEGRRDAPQLSEQSKWFGIEGKPLKEASIAWVLEMEQELWNELLAWQPSAEQTLSWDLAELSRLYLNLLEKIFTYATGENLTLQMGRLDEVLAEKLDLLIEFRIRHLTYLLAQNGQTDALKYIWRNLYIRIAGENPSNKQTERFLTRARDWAEGKSQSFSPVGPSSYSSEEGRLYHPSGKGAVEMRSGFDTERRFGELQLSQRTAAVREIQGRSAGSSSQDFSLEELMRAEKFAEHLMDGRRLYQSFENACENEEAAGYFAALISMKGQIYAADAQRFGEMGGYIERLVNQMADYYLSSKGARQVYYYTMDFYARTKDAGKSSEEGLSYAYRLFREKKEDPVYKKREAYSERAGFFQMLSGRTLEEDFQRGIGLIEKNWKAFFVFLGGNQEQDLGRTFRAQRYSPWGMMIEREKLQRERDRKAEQTLLRAALLLAAAGIVFLCWKLLFGG